MCAKDQVSCPWCGSEMHLHNSHTAVLPHEMWYGCDNCGASAPAIAEGEDPYEVAMRRIEQKPLEVSDIHEHDIVWAETKDYSMIRPIQITKVNPSYCCYYRIGSEVECGSSLGESYGRSWRCWGIAPNEYEREAAPWNDR